MVYISKINAARLLEIKIENTGETGFILILSKIILRNVPLASVRSLHLILISICLVLLINFSYLDNSVIRSIICLILPLSYLYSIIEPRNESKPVLTVFSQFSSNTLYTSLLSLCFCQLLNKELLKICLIVSVQSIFYINAWLDSNTNKLTSSLAYMKINYLNFGLVAGILIDLIRERKAFEIGFTSNEVFVNLIGVWAIIVFCYNGFDVLINFRRPAMIRLTPLLMLIVNLILWSQSEVFYEQNNWILIMTCTLGCLLSLKLKIFNPAKQPFYPTQAELFIETSFIVLETILNLIPRYPTFLLLIFFISARYFSFTISLTRQLNDLYSNHR